MDEKIVQAVFDWLISESFVEWDKNVLDPWIRGNAEVIKETELKNHIRKQIERRITK